MSDVKAKKVEKLEHLKDGYSTLKLSYCANTKPTKTARHLPNSKQNKRF